MERVTNSHRIDIVDQIEPISDIRWYAYVYQIQGN